MTTPPTPAQIAAEMNRIMTDDKTLTEIRNMAEYNLTQPARAESEKEMNLSQKDAEAVFQMAREVGKLRSDNATLTTRVAELEAGLREIATVKEHLDDDRMRETCGYEAVLMRDLARRLLESK